MLRTMINLAQTTVQTQTSLVTRNAMRHAGPRKGAVFARGGHPMADYTHRPKADGTWDSICMKTMLPTLLLDR